jgi:hypothetical protein
MLTFKDLIRYCVIMGAEEPCCLPVLLLELAEFVLLTERGAALVFPAPAELPVLMLAAPPQAERSSVKSNAKGKRCFHVMVVRMYGIRDMMYSFCNPLII